MNLLGPSSVSTTLHQIFKAAYYFSITCLTIFFVALIFGFLDLKGIQNFIATLEITSNNFDLFIKPLGTSIKSDGGAPIHGLLSLYLIMISMIFYVLLLGMITKLFAYFKSPKIFVKEVGNKSKQLTILLMASASLTFFFLLFSGGEVVHYFITFTLFISGVFLLFISAILIKGSELQSEIDLTF